MKTICKLFCIAAMSAAAGCSKMVSDPVFDEGEFYIYCTSWTAAVNVSAGSAFSITDLFVSPADGSVTCRWTLDGEVISNQRTVSCTFNRAGTYSLVFTAEKDGTSKTRSMEITVAEEASATQTTD